MYDDIADEILAQQNIDQGLTESSFDFLVSDEFARITEEQQANQKILEPVSSSFDVDPNTQSEYMQAPGEAIKTEYERFQRDGFEFDILGEIQKEIATTAMADPSSLSADMLEFAGVSPEDAFEKATGRKWIPEPILKDMADRKEISDRERQAKVREQKTFLQNMTTQFTELREAIPKLITGTFGYGADVVTDLATGDIEGLGKSLDKADNTAGVMLDEIAASAMAMLTRPVSYAREQPVDFAGWIPIAAPVKFAKGGAAAAKAARAGKTAKEVGTAGVDAFRKANTLDTIRGAGAMAAKAIESLPGGEIVAQYTYDLYAGAPEKFKSIRDRYTKDKNYKSQFIEEAILQPMQKIGKDLDDAQKIDLYKALVGNLKNVPKRKEALRLYNSLPGGRAEKKITRAGKPIKKTRKKEVIEEVDELKSQPVFDEIEVYEDRVVIGDTGLAGMEETLTYGNKAKSGDSLTLEEMNRFVGKNWEERGYSPKLEGMGDGRAYVKRFEIKEVGTEMVPTGKKIKQKRFIDEAYEEPGKPIVTMVYKDLGNKARAKKIIDSLDESDTGMIWTYDGIPMTSSEFIFDTHIGQWDPNKISYNISSNVPEIVTQQADRLLEIKKHLFESGLEQGRIRVNNNPNAINPVFLPEDYFKAMVANYAPIARIANNDLLDLNTFFKNTADFDKQVDSLGSLGRFRDESAYFMDKAKAADPLDQSILLNNERFIDAMELSLPRTTDAVKRYKFYDDIAKGGDELSITKNKFDALSEADKKKWAAMDGGVVVAKDADLGGDIMRYGALDGMYVPKNVKRIITSTERHIRDNYTAWDKVSSQYRRTLNMLKHNKLIGNVSTHVHNVIGIWSILNMEGISFTEYIKNIKEFNKKFDNKAYEAFAETGQMPKSARGFGDLSDVTNSISKVKNPTEFFKILMRDLGKKDVTTKTKLKGIGELGMQVAEDVSYKKFGLNGKMAKFFTATDRLSRYTLFKKQMEKLAKSNKLSFDDALKNKSLVDEAAQFATDAMLDYGDLPVGVQFLRESGLSPFVAYPYRAMRYFAEYPIRKPKSYIALQGLRRGIEGSDTVDERQIRRSIYPDDQLDPVPESLQGLLGEGSGISTRYWSPSTTPIETYGFGMDPSREGFLMGGADSQFYEDKMSSLVGLQRSFGVEDPIPMPEPMPLAGPIDMLTAASYGTQALLGENEKDSFGKSDGQRSADAAISAAEEFLPPYFKKTSAVPRAASAFGFEFEGDKQWGNKIPFKYKAMQSVGLRVLPQTHQSHARKRGEKNIKKLSGSPKVSNLPVRERMERESSVLRQASRNTLY